MKFLTGNPAIWLILDARPDSKKPPQDPKSRAPAKASTLPRRSMLLLLNSYQIESRAERKQVMEMLNSAQIFPNPLIEECS